MCEYDGSDQLQTVLATYEQEINQHRSKPSCQKLKTMVKRQKRSKDQDTKFFKPEMKELKQEYWWNLVNGNMSVLKGNQENAVSGKQKDSVQKDMLAGSATTTASVQQ